MSSSAGPTGRSSTTSCTGPGAAPTYHWPRAPFERQQSTIDTWLAPAHGRWGFHDYRIGSITTDAVLALFAEMRRQGRAERTVHKAYEVLNQILAAAVRDRWILTNPIERLGPTERPKATRRRSPKIMSHRQVWEVFHRIRERRGTAFPDYSLLWLTAYYQGTRAGEAIALSARDFDFDGGYFSRDNFKQRRHTGPRGLIAPMGTLLGSYGTTTSKGCSGRHSAAIASIPALPRRSSACGRSRAWATWTSANSSTSATSGRVRCTGGRTTSCRLRPIDQ